MGSVGHGSPYVVCEPARYKCLTGFPSDPWATEMWGSSVKEDLEK